jgi:hypothetical protein
MWARLPIVVERLPAVECAQCPYLRFSGGQGSEQNQSLSSLAVSVAILRVPAVSLISDES